MVINLLQIEGIRVDAVSKTAIVATGVTAEVIRVTTALYGLAPLLSQCGSVGSGIALGGGLSWLAAKYNATCDYLISATMITAKAEIQKANSTTNQDLLWTILGGGGNLELLVLSGIGYIR